MEWLINPNLSQEQAIDLLGFIPSFLDEDDPRPAKEQINEKYVGGWHKFAGHTMVKDGKLHYPGDPPLAVVAETRLRDETIRVYHHAWVAIIQADGTWEVARLD